MKFIFIIDDYLPYSVKVASKMMHELAVEFKSNGHEVWVLTPNTLQCSIFETTEIDEINVAYFKSKRIKNTNKFNRAINETFLSWRAWKSGKYFFQSNHFDGIIYYSPSIFWGFLILKLRLLWKCKSYLVLRDIFPQWTVDNGLLSKKAPAYWYFKFFEQINYKVASKIGVMSKSNLEFFTEKNKSSSKFEVLHNWSSLPQMPERNNIYLKKLNLTDKTVLFYGGNIGHAQKMIYLVNLAKYHKSNSKVHFLFVGEGDEVELILKEKEQHKLINMTYLPSIDQRSYVELLNEIDIGLFSLHPKHKTHNYPGKILNYMAYSKPVLGCVNSGNDLKDFINQANAGIVVNSGDEEELINASTVLIESEEMRKKMGENGRQLLSQELSVEAAYTTVLNHFL